MQSNNEHQEQFIPTSLLVQKGRNAATRGLLHDFSNVMVGLCSLSENAIEEIDPSNPLHDDMEIIRDSAMRAHQLIRRITTLNSRDDGTCSLVDLPTWLNNEAVTISATLPKGSETNLPDTGKTVLVNVNEIRLRDFIVYITTKITECWPNDRIRLDISISDESRQIALRLRFQNFSPAATRINIIHETDICTQPAHQLAAALDGTCRCETAEHGQVELSLHLNSQ